MSPAIGVRKTPPPELRSNPADRVPSEVILPLAGFTASRGRFSLAEVLLWTTLGSVVGALYGLGAALGRDRLRRIVDRLPLVRLSDLDRTEDWFARHGDKAVFFGRMIPIFRSLISIPAGIERMPLARFTLRIGYELFLCAIVARRCGDRRVPARRGHRAPGPVRGHGDPISPALTDRIASMERRRLTRLLGVRSNGVPSGPRAGGYLAVRTLVGTLGALVPALSVLGLSSLWPWSTARPPVPLCRSSTPPNRGRSAGRGSWCWHCREPCCAFSPCRGCSESCAPRPGVCGGAPALVRTNSRS